MERLRPDDPEQIGPWQIVNRLGSGGMGIVYMGTNGTHAAAVKVVRDFLLEDPGARARLAREVETLQKVKSNFVAEIVGSDVKSKTSWIATNYVDGPSLKVLIEKEGPLNETDWVSFADGLLSALAAVHSVGVIHRDIKPSNILMSKDGPKLIDFGIAFSKESTSLTKTGLVAGTPAWLSPEQFKNEAITTALDIFSAGSVLYYVATGTTPWGDDDSSVATIMHSLLTGDPDVSTLTELQRNLILSLLEKDYRKRVTANKALNTLREVAGTKSLSNTKVKPRKARKMNLKQILSLSSISIIAIIFAVVFINKPFMGTSSKSYIWTVTVDGDPAPQTGEGREFTAFLCDQQVIESSLKVTPNKGRGVNSTGLKISVNSGDERCGADFDTIEISGLESDKPNSVEYAVTGSTKSGYEFSYGMQVKIEEK